MNRRRVLALGAGVVSLGGCLGSNTPNANDGNPNGNDGTPTDDGETPTDDETPQENDGGLQVSDVAVWPELVAMNSPDSIGEFGDRDEQFVLARITPEDDSAPSRGDLALRANGRTYPAMTEAPGPNRHLWIRDDPYTGDRPGWAGFELPKPLAGSDVAITWPGGEHGLDADVGAELSRPPAEFTVETFETPATVEVGETVTVSLAVENVGDVDGTFVGALNRAGPLIAYAPMTAISLDVPAGETVSWEYEFDHYNDLSDVENPTMRWHLEWRGGSPSRVVDVEK